MKRIYLFIFAAALFFSACDEEENNDSLLSLLLLGGGSVEGHDWTLMSDVNTDAPSSTVKLVFIHHSTGAGWIANGNGNLGQELNANNYYATECYYEWDAETNDNLGDHTDTTDWPSWFNDTKMPYVYANASHFDYTNTISDPGGVNTIVMFKSCFPNSEVGDSIDDEKAIYSGLLAYFAAHTDRMFVLIVPPPEIDIETPELTRELANWLVAADGWLGGYAHDNVYAFDYYNVLTDPKNHHRVEGDSVRNVKHVVTDRPSRPAHPNELYYPSSSNDSHPSAEGHRKATDEFVPLLNACYNHWKGI